MIRIFFVVIDLKLPAIFDHFIMLRKEMIDEYRKNCFRSIAGTSAAPSISPVRQSLQGEL
jgi:hypothetical protein